MKEIFVFSQSNDLLFLYAMRPIEKQSFFIKHRIITELNKFKSNPEYSINQLNLEDMNKDGFDDLIFVINSGFSLQPRKIYIYNIEADSLISSQPSGSIIGDLKFVDLSGNGYPKLLVVQDLREI